MVDINSVSPVFRGLLGSCIEPKANALQARLYESTKLPLCGAHLRSPAADLQKLLCAANWLRESIVQFARFAAPLQVKLEEAFDGHSRKKRYAEGLTLTWTSEEQTQYREFLDCVARSTRLALPSETATVCVTTDASDRGWSLIVSQVESWNDSKSLTDQPHELLICKGGMLKGAQLHWSIAEKEGYPIIKAAKDLEYLLHRAAGFMLFCDHANLIQIFCPHTEIRKHVRGKLQRWALMLSDYRYEIEHVKGSDNVWADLVSRWIVPARTPHVTVKGVRTRGSREVSRLRPLHDETFVWPSLAHVEESQRRYHRFAPSSATESTVSETMLLLVEGKVWIPTQAKDLITRILVVAHCGLNTHRGADVMLRQLQAQYWIKSMRKLPTHSKAME
ncbi:Enzymatic polyprotein [Phytophthora citrophthora]|uniref:Enzymatic polyprotein n=1 Tax=Phytophthora citrophthora TaxID=4793 RepID=A0AAD9G1Z8_9STRA|nr:Enzymatic polyprotein [Phytophthora citrophthora]